MLLLILAGYFIITLLNLAYYEYRVYKNKDKDLIKAYNTLRWIKKYK